MNQPTNNEHGVFTPGGARQALEAIRRHRGGAILVTSGHQDVRFVVEPRRVSVEVAGFEMEGDDPWALCRTLLCSLFWGEATYFLQLDGKSKQGAAAIRVEAQASKVIESLDDGIRELTSLREQVPGLDILVHVTGDAPPEDVESCAANLFRVLGAQPRHLGMSAEEAGLDAIDAAWGVADLLEGEQCGVRRAPPTMGVRRLKSAEALAQEGLLPSVRHLHLARGFSRSDPKRSARHLLEAGASFLASEMHEDALAAYQKSLELAPNDTGGLEGMVRALEGLNKKPEAIKIREELIELYQSWHLPSRVLSHLDSLGALSAQQKQLRLDCLLEHRDFDAALEYSKSLLPSMTAEERYALARRFLEAGADGAQAKAMLKGAGVHRWRGPRRALILLSLLLCLGSVVLGAEVFLRQRFQKARQLTRFDLDRGKYEGVEAHWKELEGFRSKLQGMADKLPPTSALREAQTVLDELKALQEDDALLQDAKARRPLAWQEWDSTSEARSALKALGKWAQSQPLKALTAQHLAEMDAYEEVVEGEVKSFSVLTKSESKLRRAKDILSRYVNARHLFAKERVTIEVNVLPVPKLKVEWREGKKTTRARGTKSKSRFEVLLPLQPDATGTILVSAPNHISQERSVTLNKSTRHSQSFELVRSVPTAPRVLHPAKRPGSKVPKGGGLVVLRDVPSPALVRDLRRGGVESVVVNESKKDLQFLAAQLQSGERLVIELLMAVEPGRRTKVFLSGIQIWLDRGQALGSGRLLDLRSALRGLRRPLEVKDGTAVVSSLSKTRGFDRVRAALASAVGLERSR